MKTRNAALRLLGLSGALWLAACGGGGQGTPSTAGAAQLLEQAQAGAPRGNLTDVLEPQPSPRNLATARTASPLTPDELFNWLESLFPTIFPPGPVTKPLAGTGISFKVRYYPSTNTYAGVGDQDGHVYGLGPFTGNQLIDFGALSTFACDVKSGCFDFTPDADGNLAAGVFRTSSPSVRAGGTLSFKSLTPADAVVEVGSPTLTGTQLCNDANLPAGGAHAAALPSPTATSHYERNELSGPYRTYPAGMFIMSVGTDTCGYVESASGCTAPNETEVSRQARPGGGNDSLCVVTPYLMNSASPSRPTTTPNPACVRNQVLASTWADPGLQGVFLRLSWKAVNPAQGVYDWTSLDREFIAALRHGKTVTVGLEVGGNSIPDWVFTTGAPGVGAARKLMLKDWGTAPDSAPNANCGFDYAVASPSDAAFKALFKQALTEMASHIRADQRKFSVLTGVKVTGMGMATLENRLPARCNIAVRNPALGDSGTQGHIISMSTTSLSNPVFDSKYNLSTDPTFSRVSDTSQCVCNPQVLAAAGYRPSTLRAFYSEVEALLAAQFGFKQQVFMNVNDGFPQVGETGRFLGDHLKPAITSIGYDAAGQPVYTYGAVQASRASVPTQIPDANDLTAALLDDGRAGVFANGDLIKAKGFGVQNAGLDAIGFSKAPNTGVRCSQQVGIDTAGVFAGSPSFPIASSARVDARTAGCPNLFATQEGITYEKAGGFQIVAGLGSTTEIDAALWNLTLNTNGLFFEEYESNAWNVSKQSAWNAGAAINPQPAVKTETATANGASATAKSSAGWNSLLLARAKAFSELPAHNNLFERNPFATEYAVDIASAPATQRHFFNARACQAYRERGVPVRVNTVSVLN